MKFIIKTLIFLVFLTILTACSSQNVVLINNENEKVKIKVEIADTFDERAEGLMFREFLEENKGMLFVFEQEDYYGFWMKNTLIPLDIIYISENNEIVGIKNNAEPCKEDPCISYKPTKPAKYVLEVNSNFTIKNNIQIGNKVIFN